MKRRLNEPDTGSVVFMSAVHHSLHQLAADPEILHAGVDGDGADAANHGALIEAIAANDAAVGFSYHAVEARARKHHRKEADGGLWPWKIARETVRRADR